MKLTRPKSELAPRYDAVVIGSGYGGGIAALRLAEAGRSVAVFERGREHPPSSFPERAGELLAEVQARVDVDGVTTQVGSRLGLFDVRVHQGLSAIVGCGVGGTSLINASVFCAPDDALWSDARWPEALRADEAGRKAALARAERLLVPTAEGPELDKTRFMRELGDASGRASKRLPLMIRTKADVESSCNGCGNCVSGCRRGAKRTVDRTYLTQAVAHGAQIFSELDVRWIERRGAAWAVHYAPVCRPVDAEHEASFVVADVVVLAAGSLGSTEILARSKARGLPVSDALGTSFSGNGNGVGLVETSARGVRTVAPSSLSGGGGGEPGPCITMAIDLPADGPPVHLEDGTAPSALAGVLRTTGLIGRARDRLDRAASPVRGLAAMAKEALVTALEGSVDADDGAQLVLLQTDDGARGRLVLGPAGIAIDWPDYARAVAHTDDAIRRLAAAADAVYRPLHPTLFGVAGHVTVHPLGGCPMGDDSTVGVVDDACAVFDPSASDRHAVHDGLFVCDGAVLPRAVGKNPAATICVIAERALALYAARHPKKERSRAAANAHAAIAAVGSRPGGFVLAEAFDGWLSTARPCDPAGASATGHQGPMSYAAHAHFTIEIEDVADFRRAASHPASVTGTLTSPLFEVLAGAATASVVRGKVFLLTDDPEDLRLFYNLYELGLVDARGAEYTLTGMKAWRHGGPGAVWGDGTQMPIDLFLGDGADGRPLAKGFLRMSAPQFLGSLRSYRARGERSLWEAVQRRGAFVGFSAARVASRLFGSGR